MNFIDRIMNSMINSIMSLDDKLTRKIRNKYLFFLPALLWMTFIFWMSHQTGEDSSELSNTLVIWILEHIPFDITSLSYFVRKAAHMFEYFMLFLLTYYGFIHLDSTKKLLQKSPLLLSYLVSFLYACTDEFHQMFVPDRGPSMKDVFIDSIGVTIGLVVVVLLQKLLAERADG